MLCYCDWWVERRCKKTSHGSRDIRRLQTRHYIQLFLSRFQVWRVEPRFVLYASGTQIAYGSRLGTEESQPVVPCRPAQNDHHPVSHDAARRLRRAGWHRVHVGRQSINQSKHISIVPLCRERIRGAWWRKLGRVFTIAISSVKKFGF